jgi:adenylosuccinate lyase
MEGRENDLLDRIIADSSFGLSRADIDGLLRLDEFVGRAPQQVREFISGHIDPLLDKAKQFGTALATDLKV